MEKKKKKKVQVNGNNNCKKIYREERKERQEQIEGMGSVCLPAV